MNGRTFWGAGDRAPEDVWRDYISPARWSDWAPHMREVRGLTEPLRPGATGQVRVLGRVSVRVQVLTVDDSAMRWSWAVHLRPVTIVMTHWVEALEHGSRALVGLAGPPLPCTLYRRTAVRA